MDNNACMKSISTTGPSSLLVSPLYKLIVIVVNLMSTEQIKPCEFFTSEKFPIYGISREVSSAESHLRSQVSLTE